MRPPLPAAEVIKAIEHKSPSRVPMMLHFWTNADRFEGRAPAVRQIMDEYPSDVFVANAVMPAIWDSANRPADVPKYSWMHLVEPPAPAVTRGHDANVAIEDWSQLDGILAAWPDPTLPHVFANPVRNVRENAAGRYVLATWWYCLYERLWSLRGMENIMLDFYLNPQPLHRLMDALTDFYCGLIRNAAKEVGCHGIFTSDDIGMQTGPMFSREIFLEFFKPRYARIIKTAHDLGMHFWLHTCGDVRLFMEDFIEIGLDVIHPIQKYTMSEPEIARHFGGRICFWAGMDVQQTLPGGTPQAVRDEVRFMIDTYDRPDGGCMITAGNCVTPDVPVENLRAFFDETYNYGLSHRNGGVTKK